MTKNKQQQVATEYAQNFLDKLLEKEYKKQQYNLNHNSKNDR